MFRSKLIGESDTACLTQVRYNQLRRENRDIFNEWDAQLDLEQQSVIALNIVPFNANLILDYQSNDPDMPYTYAPHQPLDILNNQNIMNLCTKNSAELNLIFSNIEKKKKAQPSGLELIMSTYKSTRRGKIFKERGLILDQNQLYSTFDFNFDNVLSHAIDNGIKLSIEFIMNHIQSQGFDRFNYDIIMMNLEKLLDK